MPYATSGNSNIGSAQINDGAIVNADINAGAAIDWTKINSALQILNADIGANAAIAISKLAPLLAATAVIPRPEWPSVSDSSISPTGNTTCYLARIRLNSEITVQAITVRVLNSTTGGTFKVALFSEDGQTRYVNGTTGATSANTNISASVAPTKLYPGVYYFAVVPVSTVNVQLASWSGPSAAMSALVAKSSEPVFAGTVACSADTMPTTITPTSITAVDADGIVCRLDN